MSSSTSVTNPLGASVELAFAVPRLWTSLAACEVLMSAVQQMMLPSEVTSLGLEWHALSQVALAAAAEIVAVAAV